MTHAFGKVTAEAWKHNGTSEKPTHTRIMSRDELLAKVIITVCPDLSCDLTTAATHKTKQDKPISCSHTDTDIIHLYTDMTSPSPT